MPRLAGRAYQLAREAGLLLLRVQLMVSADRLRPVAAHDADGGMMARTAALSAPYEGPGHSGQLQDAPEALAQSIVDGHLARWEDAAGWLTPGKRADLVVLGDDPRRVEVSRIGDIEVVTTYVAGRPAG